MMGKIKRFEIVFSNNSGAFYAGQQVTGNVLVDSTYGIKLKSIKLRFYGESFVSFTDNTKKKAKHSDKQNYFDQVDILFGNPDASITTESSSLPAGLHEYPFVFNAPGHLPSSFESKDGYVRYWCNASLHLPFLKRDKSTKKPFSIISIVDLNREQMAFTPGHAYTERRFSFSDRLLCCVRGGLSVRVTLPRSAFVSGEDIPISAEITNHSSERIKKVEAYLQQNVIFTAKTGQRFVKGEAKIGHVTQGAVKPGKSQIWQEESISVPSLPPSKLGGCKLISVDYVFNFVVRVESAEDIHFSLPIVIGTVPLHLQPLNWLPPSYDQQPSTSASAPPQTLPRQPSAPPAQDDYLGRDVLSANNK